MYLKIDFYSKNEVSVDHDLTNLYGNYSDQFRNLLLISTYLTRTFQNFGNHPIGIILSDLLLHFSEQDLYLLYIGKYKFLDFTETQDLLYRNNLYSVLEADIIISKVFYPMPNLVEARWRRGRKAFYLSLSPCKLDIKGFTILGIDLSYFALQAVVATINSLGRVFQSDPAYANHLLSVINSISRSYRTGEVYTPQNAELFSLSVLRRITGE